LVACQSRVIDNARSIFRAKNLGGVREKILELLFGNDIGGILEKDGKDLENLGSQGRG